MKYLKNITSYKDLKEKYRSAIKANHPDNGGTTEAMQEINNEYEILFRIWKDKAEKAGTLEESEKEETASGTRRKFYSAYGWEGSRYDSKLTLKEIAVIVRGYVKEKYPTCKFSVRTFYASMCQELRVEIKEFPDKMYKTGADLIIEGAPDWNNGDIAITHKKMRNNGYFDLGSWTLEEFATAYDVALDQFPTFYGIQTEYFKAVLEDVDTFIKSYNYDDSDYMTDYHDVNFYYFGCKFEHCKQVKKTARIKNEKKTPARQTISPADRETAKKAVEIAKNSGLNEAYNFIYSVKVSNINFVLDSLRNEFVA